MQAHSFTIQVDITLLAVRLGRDAVLRQQLGDGAQGGERGAKLVRDGGYEIGLKLSNTNLPAKSAIDDVARAENQYQRNGRSSE